MAIARILGRIFLISFATLILAALSMPRNDRDRANLRACYANQKTFLGAIELYRLDKNIKEPMRTHRVSRSEQEELVRGCYLQCVVPDPGQGPAQVENIVALEDLTGSVCLVHGSQKASGSPRQELEDLGVSDVDILQAARNVDYFYARPPAFLTNFGSLIGLLAAIELTCYFLGRGRPAGSSWHVMPWIARLALAAALVPLCSTRPDYRAFDTQSIWMLDLFLLTLCGAVLHGIGAGFRKLVPEFQIKSR